MIPTLSNNNRYISSVFCFFLCMMVSKPRGKKKNKQGLKNHPNPSKLCWTGKDSLCPVSLSRSFPLISILSQNSFAVRETSCFPLIVIFLNICILWSSAWNLILQVQGKILWYFEKDRVCTIFVFLLFQSLYIYDYIYKLSSSPSK